jgi:hypothetical protein
VVTVFATNSVDRGFEPRSDQTKDYTICICCFSSKHTSLRRKSRYWLDRNQVNVSDLGDLSIRRLVFHWASTTKIQLRVLVLYKADLIIISLKISLFSPWYTWKIAELPLNNNHSLTHNCSGDRHWLQGVKVMMCNVTLTIYLLYCQFYWWKNHRPAASHRQTLSHYVVSSTPHHERDSNPPFYWW